MFYRVEYLKLLRLVPSFFGSVANILFPWMYGT